MVSAEPRTSVKAMIHRDVYAKLTDEPQGVSMSLREFAAVVPIEVRRDHSFSVLAWLSDPQPRMLGVLDARNILYHHNAGAKSRIARYSWFGDNPKSAPGLLRFSQSPGSAH